MISIKEPCKKFAGKEVVAQYFWHSFLGKEKKRKNKKGKKIVCCHASFFFNSGFFLHFSEGNNFWWGERADEADFHQRKTVFVEPHNLSKPPKYLLSFSRNFLLDTAEAGVLVLDLNRTREETPFAVDLFPSTMALVGVEAAVHHAIRSLSMTSWTWLTGTCSSQKRPFSLRSLLPWVVLGPLQLKPLFW